MFLVLVGKYLTYLPLSSSNDEVVRVMNTAARARSAIICLTGAATKAEKGKGFIADFCKTRPKPPYNLKAFPPLNPLYHRSNLDSE